MTHACAPVACETLAVGGSVANAGIALERLGLWPTFGPHDGVGSAS